MFIFTTIMCLLIGIGFIVACLVLILKTKTIRKWPQVDGKIIKRQWVEGPDMENMIITYEYYVDGTKYTNTRVALTRERAKAINAIRAEFEDGGIYPVSYNPDKISTSYLVRDYPIRLFILLLCCSSFFLFLGILCGALYFSENS